MPISTKYEVFTKLQRKQPTATPTDDIHFISSKKYKYLMKWPSKTL